jgi:DNA-binding HxlR family transcriptional regulator
MKGYGQFCPVAKAAEILNERWTLLIIRELLGGSSRFNKLRRGVPLMSSSLLSQRLKSLERVGVVERNDCANGHGSEYHLTRAGEELHEIVTLFGEWGQRWVRSRVEELDLDAGLLMWDMRGRIDPGRFPNHLTTIQFEYPDMARTKRYWWLVVQAGEIELCLTDPGFPVDLYILTDLCTMTQVWMGDISLREAQARELIELQGDMGLIRKMPRWLARSKFATVERGAVRAIGTPCNAASVSAASG